MGKGVGRLWVTGAALSMLGLWSAIGGSRAFAAGMDGGNGAGAPGKVAEGCKRHGSSKGPETRGEPLAKMFEIAGGISAGEFHASHAGPDTRDDELLLSNLLLQVSTRDESLPVTLVAAFGETSTPSLLSPPERNNQFEFQYASASIKPFPGLGLEAGLLRPCSGYEDSYTYNNPNVTFGILASQQPSNAYGGRVTYALGRVTLHAGYYAKRLDREEYGLDDGTLADGAWELALTGTAFDVSYCVYNYHVNGLRNLTGAVLEHDLAHVHFVLNLDAWKWDGEISRRYADSGSVGAALYIIPCFGRFSVPVRLEWVDQGGSELYLDNPDTDVLYAATVSPTYRFTDKAYVRVESSYAYGNNGFATTGGRVADDRVYLAAEIGYVF